MHSCWLLYRQYRIVNLIRNHQHSDRLCLPCWEDSLDRHSWSVPSSCCLETCLSSQWLESFEIRFNLCHGLRSFARVLGKQILLATTPYFLVGTITIHWNDNANWIVVHTILNNLTVGKDCFYTRTSCWELLETSISVTTLLKKKSSMHGPKSVSHSKL
jgi:hypothetical protein